MILKLHKRIGKSYEVINYRVSQKSQQQIIIIIMIIRMIMMMIIFTITISKRVFLCACFISTYQMLYGLHWGRQVLCGRRGQKGGQDQ